MPIVQHIQTLTGEALNAQVLEPVHFDCGIPIDHHLPQSKRIAILAHQFIDFGTLVKKITHGPTTTFALKLKDDDTIVLENEYQIKLKDINLWVTPFAIYATVLCRAYPEMSVGLFHYMSHIRDIQQQGFDWTIYDVSFRHLHASNIM